MPSRPSWVRPAEQLVPAVAVTLALVPLLGAVVLAFGRGGYVVDGWGGWATISLLALAAAVCSGMTAHPSAAGLAAPWCLAGLGAWSLMSAGWSPFPQMSLVEGGRELWYASVVALGVLLLHTRTRRRLAVAAVAFGSAAVAAGHVAAMLTGPDPSILANGRLVGSIGNGGGLACAVGIGVWPLVAFASDRAAAVAVRAAAAGGAGAAVASIIATQARAGLWSTLAAGLVYFILVRRRARAAAVLAAPAVAVALSWDALNATFRTGGADAGQIAVTGRAMAAVAAVAVVGLLAVALVERRVRVPLRGTTRGAARTAGMALVALALVVAGVAVGDPVQRGEQLWADFKQPAAGDAQRTRFGTLSTDRYDLWRVGLLAFARDPLTGVGAGSFSGVYQRERRSGQQVVQAHSQPIEVLATVGYPGLLLLVAAGGLPIAAAVRLSRDRAGPRGDRALGAALAAALCGFTVQATVDWNWHIAAAAVPAMTLAGAALARPGRASRPPLPALALVLGAVAIAVAVIAPATLAQRYLKRSYVAPPAEALQDARRADRLDVLSGRPQVAMARAHLRAGDAAAAIDAARAATDAEPRWWVAWQVLAVAAARDGRFRLEADALRHVARLAPMLPARQQGVLPSVDFDHY